MNDESAVSVCMATRNGELYLEAQLRSIISQLQPGDELVVSDDSSTDHTVEILKRFEGPQVRLFLGNSFFDPIGNFEHCLRQARHDILVLADQDDVWLDNRLPVVRQHMAGRTGKICAIMTDADLIDADGQATGRTLFHHFRASNGLLRNLFWNCYTGCAMAISRPLFELALPFPKGIPMHDAWLGLLSEAVGSMELIQEKTFLYRRHQHNASGWRWQPVRQVCWRWVLMRQLWKRVKRQRLIENQKGAISV
jgi:glycosyltransferase involved in cell wall biosynthesis